MYSAKYCHLRDKNMTQIEKKLDILETKPVLFAEERVGKFFLGVIELNRPQSLNALNTLSYDLIESRLAKWESNESIAAIIIHSRSDRAFCAGGDVKNLVIATKEHGISAAKDFFTREYFIDHLMHVYRKPIIVFADGTTMGAGIGLMNGASHRVVTERTIMSMPEQAIGFFPDVGATQFLYHLPHRFGLFMGLCGARIKGEDAINVGLADFYMESKSKRKIHADLLRLPWVGRANEDHELATHYLARALKRPPRRSPDSDLFSIYQKELAPFFIEINKFDQNSYLRVFEQFLEHTPQSEFIAENKKRFLSGSPTSKQVFFEAFDRHKNLKISEVFCVEWEMAISFSKENEFYEGVRAVLIDKDQNPKWNPADETNVKNIERFFLSGEENELRKRLAYSS